MSPLDIPIGLAMVGIGLASLVIGVGVAIAADWIEDYRRREGEG